MLSKCDQIQRIHDGFLGFRDPDDALVDGCGSVSCESRTLDAVIDKRFSKSGEGSRSACCGRGDGVNGFGDEVIVGQGKGKGEVGGDIEVIGEFEFGGWTRSQPIQAASKFERIASFDGTGEEKA